jgi:trehalose/maltose hydrolase-like predicted phosphorylase
MNLPRRSFVRGSAGLICSSLIPRNVFGAFQQSPVPTSASWQSSGPLGLPKIVVEDFSKSFDPAYLSNGLIGIRPGPNPLGKAMTQVSGFVFAHQGHEVESLSPAPYPLETDIRVHGTSLLKRSDLLKVRRQTLDMSCGELITEMSFVPDGGVALDIRVVQFASRSVPGLLCQEIQVTSSASTEIEFELQIDREAAPGQIFMTEPPERTKIDLVCGLVSSGSLSKLGVAIMAVTPNGPVQKQDPIRTETGVKRSFVLRGEGGQPVRLQTIAAMISDLYHPEPPLEAIRLAEWGSMLGFEYLRNRNRDAWNDLWQSRVKVAGKEDAQRVLDAGFYYLQSSLHASTRTGMPPFGLSQFSYYYGHSFWDTETWSLLAITLTAPATARALLQYRLRGLEWAKREAALYGYRGAQYPWEAAQTSGFETTPTFAATGWAEQHVSPDVALGFWEYQLATNDEDFLKEGTWPVLKAVAEWIESRGVATNRGFEIQHVMGPDEGVIDINNDSYMNLSCKLVLAAAIRCGQLTRAAVPGSWARIRDSLVVPIDKSRNVVLPYDQPSRPLGRQYSLGGIDFLNLHGAPLSLELLRNTFEYQEKLRQADPTGTSMIGFATAAVAATAAMLGKKRRAAELFEQSWKDVWLEPFGMIREGPLQDYGCFLTNFGSLLQTAILGFTGLRITEGDWQKYPASLPAGWTEIEIGRLWVKGEPKHLVTVDGRPAKLLSA